MGAGSNEANRRLREMQYERQFGGAPATTAPRVVPPIEGVVRGAGPAPGTREGGEAPPHDGNRPLPAESLTTYKPAPAKSRLHTKPASPPPAAAPTTYKDFREATDVLLLPISHDDLAARFGVSVGAFRQARLSEDAQAHRSPPKRWEDVLVEMAEDRAAHYLRLADAMRAQREAKCQ